MLKPIDFFVQTVSFATGSLGFARDDRDQGA